MRSILSLSTCCALLLAAGCGAEAPEPFVVEWRESKPNARIGRVRAAVVERPSQDRARIEARWENRSGAAGCTLELLVPDGVIVLEGERHLPIPLDGGVGSATWLVEFPVGRELDAVLRFCAETEDGVRAAETTVRLTDGP